MFGFVGDFIDFSDVVFVGVMYFGEFGMEVVFMVFFCYCFFGSLEYCFCWICDIGDVEWGVFRFFVGVIFFVGGKFFGGVMFFGLVRDGVSVWLML